MITANYLLLTLGILGATDILLYHSVSHGIRTHTESRRELITHALRGPTYATLFLVVPNFQLHGAFAVMLALLLIFDTAISIADFWLERQSRAALGGLPSGEYVLHMLMAMLFGAFIMALGPTLLASIKSESAIHAGAYAPLWLRATLATFALGVFVSGLMDLLAALKLRKTYNSACQILA